MKRIFYKIGISYMFATLFACLVGFDITSITGIFLALGSPFVILVINEKYKIICKMILYTAAVAINMFNIYYIKNILPIEKLNDCETNITFTVVGFAVNDTIPVYFIKSTENADRVVPNNSNIILYSNNEMKFDLYDKVQGDVRFFKPKERINFNSEEYYKTKGIFLFARLVDQNVKTTQAENNDMKFKPMLFNKYISGNIREVFLGYQGDVMKAMILGDKSGIDPELKNIFRRSGIYHILVVSGLHMSIIVQSIYKLFLKLKFGNTNSSILSIVNVLVFMLLIGFSPSVLRCGLMTIIYFIGQIVSRKSDQLNSLGFSLLAILFFNPYSILDVGLQLSFLSTWGIIFIAPSIITFLKAHSLHSNSFINSLRGALGVSIAANVSTFPIIALNFKEISVVAPLTNVMISPILPFTFVISIICATLKPIFYGGVLYKLLTLIAGSLITLITDVARIFAGFKCSVVRLNEEYVAPILICALFGCTFVYWYYKNDENCKKITQKYLCVIICALFLAGVLFDAILSNYTAKLYVLDDGNIFINCNGQNLAIGATKNKSYYGQLNKCLFESGKDKLNMFVSVPLKKEEETLQLLSSNVKIDSLLVNKSNNIKFLNDNISIMELTKHKIFKLGDNVFLELIRVNNAFIVAFNYKGNVTVSLDKNLILKVARTS